MLRPSILVALLAAPAAAQASYSFNALQGSDTHPYTLLDGQDGWSEQTFNARQRCGVTATLSHDATPCLRFQEVGPGYGCDASRKNDAAWSFAPLVSTQRNAYFQADMFVGYWGGTFGMAYDANTNGIVRGSEAGERGVRFVLGTQSNVQLQLVPASGAAVRVPLAALGIASGQWIRVRVLLDLAANGAGGLGSVEVQNLTLGQTSFTSVPGLQDVPLGLDPSATDARNAALWDALFLHFEGATYMLDNIEVGRAGFARAFGSGCAAGAGTATLSAQGQLQAGGVLQLDSSGHAAGQPGVLLLGISDASYLGLALPLALDPLLGTSGCSLFTSIDATASGITSASAPAVLSFSFGVPSPTFSARLYAQTLTLAPVPGGLALSNGLLLQLR
ncbi:MAG: hypothetical protein IPN34_00380 [Planctomycetes bacterium]|nr:hypothetical protein [Planctomycetota bacterium]